jgi:hypothetical protein
MKIRMFIVFQVVALLFIEMTTMAVDHATSELSCPQSALQMQYSSGTCSAPVETFFPPVPDKSLPLLPKLIDLTEKKDFQHTTQDKLSSRISRIKRPLSIYFGGRDAPTVKRKDSFLKGLPSGDGNFPNGREES